MKKITVLLADQFEEIEVVAPIDIWRRAGFDVTITSIKKELTVIGQQKLTIRADNFLSDTNIDDIDVLFIPGGAGHQFIKESSQAMEIIDQCIILNKLIVSICAAPTILSTYLTNKKATCYPSMKDLLTNWVNESVVIDLPFITSQGAGTAFELGYKIVELLNSKEAAEELKNKMIFKN